MGNTNIFRGPPKTRNPPLPPPPRPPGGLNQIAQWSAWVEAERLLKNGGTYVL